MEACLGSLILLFYAANAFCICRPKGSLCSDGYTKSCTDGSNSCDHIDLYSGIFELTNACVKTNGGVTPRVRIRGADIYLNLEKGVYDEIDIFEMAGNGASVHLIGDYRVDRFWGFNLWTDDNTIYFETETVFENKIWTIKYGSGEKMLDFIFNKQATFNNFCLSIVDNSKKVFKENVKFQTESTLNLPSSTSLHSYKLFECENSNVNINSVNFLCLNQTQIKSNSQWNIKGINTYFVIGNGVTCCLSRYESERNIKIGSGNKITVDLLVIKNEYDVSIMNQFIPKGYNLYSPMSVIIDSTSKITTYQTIELNDNSGLIINGITITVQELKCYGNGIVKVINGATLIMNSFNFYDSCQLIVEDSTLSKPFINFHNNSTVKFSDSSIIYSGKNHAINLFDISSVIFENNFYLSNTELNRNHFLFSTQDNSKLIFKNGYQSNGIIPNQQWNNSLIIIKENCEVELTTIYYENNKTKLIIGDNSNLKLEYLTINGSDFESINLNEKVKYKGYYLIGDYELNVNKTNEYGVFGDEKKQFLDRSLKTENMSHLLYNGSSETILNFSIINYTDISFINNASLYLNNDFYLNNSIISFKDSHLGGNSQINLNYSSITFEGNCQIEGNPRISFVSLPVTMTVKDNAIINKNCLVINGNIGTIIIGNYSNVYFCSLDNNYWNKIEIGTDSLLRLKTFHLYKTNIDYYETSIDYGIDSLILPNYFRISKALDEKN